MGRREREHIVRVVDDDGAVAFRRERRIAVQPGARRVGVSPCEIARVQALHLDCGEARGRFIVLLLRFSVVPSARQFVNRRSGANYPAR